MRLIKQNIEKKDGSGTATLLPEEPEDMVTRPKFLLQQNTTDHPPSGTLTT